MRNRAAVDDDEGLLCPRRSPGGALAATSSLPHPVSPWMRTVRSVGAILPRADRRSHASAPPARPADPNEGIWGILIFSGRRASNFGPRSPQGRSLVFAEEDRRLRSEPRPRTFRCLRLPEVTEAHALGRGDELSVNGAHLRVLDHHLAGGVAADDQRLRSDVVPGARCDRSGVFPAVLRRLFLLRQCNRDVDQV